MLNGERELLTVTKRVSEIGLLAYGRPLLKQLLIALRTLRACDCVWLQVNGVGPPVRLPPADVKPEYFGPLGTMPEGDWATLTPTNQRLSINLAAIKSSPEPEP